MKKNKAEKATKSKTKKTRSIFLKIALIMTPIVLMLDLVVLFLSYNITHESAINNCKNQLRIAASNAVQCAQSAEMDNLGLLQRLNDEYNSICKLFDITYVFAVKINPEENTETYMAIGFGSDATQEAKETRFSGTTVEGSVNDAEMQAFNGDQNGVFSYEKNRFGETLICYMPCTRYYDYQAKELRELETPLVIGAELSLNAITNSFQHKFRLIALLTIALTLVIVVAFALMLYFRVSRPVRKISRRMSSFVTDREKKKGVEKLAVKGNDEFSLMADSFNIMTEEIDRYINDIDTLNFEKHTQEAELNIARNIQMGLLCPASSETEAADIRAYMLPAKDVGGDLYDYCMLPDGRIFVAIADVSGKGISAALFMARAITLLHQYAQMCLPPAQILEEYNNTMAAQNPGGLFITTFLAIWDPATNELIFSNAGHNFPYVLSDTLIRLEDAHGVAAGLFEGEKYHNASVVLKEGDVLFLYTDGVNEAKNTNDAFYSTERLENRLAACIGAGSTDPLNDILRDLNSFTQGASQSDDVTLLTLRVKPRQSDTVLHLKSELTQLPAIRGVIRALNVSDDVKKTLFLAAEEIFVNICNYAYDPPGDVELRIADGDRIRMTFTDSGKRFDPTADILDIDDYDHENCIGGLGRFLTFSVADEYSYEYRDGKNILTLIFQRGD